jgi:nucleoside-diphosphate-sugar epimerase
MGDGTVAVTGVSGFIGQRLLPLLDASGAVERIVGLDVRDPARRARKLTFHRTDVVNGDLAPYLQGVDTVVHLAAVVGPILDEVLLTRVNAEGMRRTLSAASASSVRKVVRPSSATVYGAWPNNPIPISEDAPLRPNPGYLPAVLDGECERMLADWQRARAGRVATRLRIAPVVGPGAQTPFAAAATGRPPIVVRNAAPPVQVVHVDDVVSALLLAVEQDLDGTFNVAADGWLTPEDARALLPTRHVPALPLEVAERLLAALWATGLGDVPPSLLPYLAHPWVIANDRLKDVGWKPRHTNEEAILLGSPADGPSVVPWAAAVGAVLVGAAGATWWLTRARRR